MANTSLVSSVRDLFPDVAAAAEQYRRAKLDRESRNLARRLTNEEALYDQFMHKLWLVSSSKSSAPTGDLLPDIEGRLGGHSAVSLVDDLRQMEEFLRSLKADLVNTSRGTEVLAKLRHKTTIPRGQQPNASFQKRLDELSTVNRRLAAYLLDRQLLLPLASDTKDILDFRLFIPQHRDDPTEVLQVTGGRYTCACQDGLLASAIDSVHHPSSSYRGNNSKSDNGINNSAVLLQRSYGHISISINSLQESEGNIWSVKGIRSAIGSASEREEFQINRVAVDSDSKVFVLTIKQIQAPPNSVSFEELLSGRAIAVDQKRRMELAFQLSSSVILLWTSHWLEVARYWKDWTASFSIDEDGDVCNIFLSPKSRPINPATRLRPEPMSVLTREPILTRLGLRLIELAFGRTLSELKREDGSMAQTEEEQRDQDVSDLLVAKRLLALRRICAEFGPNFESVVNICINQQYREYKGASIKELSFGDQSFLESAAVTILLPLYETVRRNFGCTCNAAKYNLVDRATLEVEDYQGVDDATLRDEQIVPYFNSEVQTSTKHRATDATIHERNQHMASSAQRRYGLSRTGNAETRDFGGTESAEVGFKERSVPQLYSISNVVGDQSFTDPTIPGQVKRMVEPNEEFAHPSSMQANPRSEVGKDTRQRQTVGPKNGTKVVNSKQQLLPPSQAGDTDATSDYSFENLTVTTDSAFAWIPNDSDEPPTIRDNHPLLLFQDVTLRVLMKFFYAWRQCAYGPSESSGPVNRTSTAESSKKRSRAQRENDQDEDDDQDEGASPNDTAASKKKRRVNKATLTFSCPFFKKDNVVHRRCCGYTLTRIRDVKQHLSRRHQMPIYCPRCFENFFDEEVRDTHIRDVDCERQSHGKPEGITEAQRRLLSKKSPAKQSEEDQWYGIFDILFPNHKPRPESPYMDTDLFQNIMGYQAFLTAHGPRIIRDILTRDNAVTWNLPIGQSDMEAFQRRILEMGIQEMYDAWTIHNRNRAPESDALNHSPESSAENHQHSRVHRQGAQLVTTATEGYEEQHSVDTQSAMSVHSTAYDSSIVSWDTEDNWVTNPHISAEMDGVYDAILSEEADRLGGIFSDMGLRGPS